MISDGNGRLLPVQGPVKKDRDPIGDVKRNLALTRLRLRGLTGARDEFLMTAIVLNLKRLTKIASIEDIILKPDHPLTGGNSGLTSQPIPQENDVYAPLTCPPRHINLAQPCPNLNSPAYLLLTRNKKRPSLLWLSRYFHWLRGLDLNQRPSGYEPLIILCD